MTKFYKLIEVTEAEMVKNKTFVVLTDDRFMFTAPGNKTDFALHLNEGSALVVGLENLIKGVDLTL